MATSDIGMTLVAVLVSPALWAAVASACAVLLLSRTLLRAIGSPGRDSASGPWQPTLEQSDRRGSFRVPGSRSRVLIAGLDRNEPSVGRVLDRSGTGVRVQASLPAPEGTRLLVRAARASADSPWVPVTVRWCRPTWRAHVLGCQFVDDLPTETLALFD